MKWLDLSLETPARNVGLDEALLLAAEGGNGGQILRVWESDVACVVLGAGCTLKDVDEKACEADGVPLLRRGSGGGTVLLGPGCLLYSLVLSYDLNPQLRQIGPSYRFILERICLALDVPTLKSAGVSDLALDSLKISGNAQQRKRNHLLHHGTLLYAFDTAKVGRYLHMPSRQPEYRRCRPDTEFLTNLPLGREEIVKRLRQAFAADCDLEDWPAEAVGQLVANKYGLAEWTRGRG